MNKLLLWASPVLCCLFTTANAVFAQDTAFTYQGRLNNNGSPANGSYDLTFTLFNANSNGVAVAQTVTNQATAVANGLFTAIIDFGGGVFTGSNYWLEIGARPNGMGGFTTLAPRQPILPAPYAIYSPNAGVALTAASAGSISAANITGTIPLAQLPGAVVTNNENGVTFSGNLTVNGGLAVAGIVSAAGSSSIFLPTNLWAFGDSIVYGYGANCVNGSEAPPYTNGYVYQVANSLGISVTNKGAAGAVIEDTELQIFYASIPSRLLNYPFLFEHIFDKGVYALCSPPKINLISPSSGSLPLM